MTFYIENGLADNHSIFSSKLYDSFKRYLKPSFHSLDDGRNFKYTKKQLELSISKQGEQKIKGIVGAGKTLVLAKRAVNAHIRDRRKSFSSYLQHFSQKLYPRQN